MHFVHEERIGKALEAGYPIRIPHDEYLKQPWRHRKHTHRCASKLFDVQVNARELGCPALFEAAAAARREVEAVAARPD